jgi:hypothetical protein
VERGIAEHTPTPPPPLLPFPKSDDLLTEWQKQCQGGWLQADSSIKGLWYLSQTFQQCQVIPMCGLSVQHQEKSFFLHIRYLSPQIWPNFKDFRDLHRFHELWILKSWKSEKSAVIFGKRNPQFPVVTCTTKGGIGKSGKSCYTHELCVVAWDKISPFFLMWWVTAEATLWHQI